MKIVINIDEDYYEIIKHDVKVNHNDFKPYTIIANGTPLPKGHGRLIDADDIRCERNDFDTYDDYCVMFYEINNASTILEADIGETE